MLIELNITIDTESEEFRRVAELRKSVNDTAAHITTLQQGGFHEAAGAATKHLQELRRQTGLALMNMLAWHWFGQIDATLKDYN